MSDRIEPVEGPSTWEQFADIVCGFRKYVQFLFAFQMVALLLLVFSWQFGESDTSQAILQLDFLLLGLTLPPVVVILVGCQRRDYEWQ